MLNKTHIAIGVFFMLIFISDVVYKGTYIIVFLVATLLPNLDAFLSGHTSIFMKPMRLFVKKRGFFHSFTFCFLITGLLAWFWPIFAFPFFLGYGIHLLVDAWTVDGIMPFWPLRTLSKGRVRTGGGLEHFLFYSFLIADAVAIWMVFL